MRELRVVLTGEVDCGKSTLIGRLLYDTDSVSPQVKQELNKTCEDLGRGLEFAYLLDSFKEEREEEFTLDTTQASLRFKNKEYLFVDVPGHRQLLKNMLTGASFADVAVLVVDVNKLLKEQTKRHLYLLRFLGLEPFIIAVNKLDAISYSRESFSRIKIRIEKFLKEAGFYSKYIIPVSAREGENLITPSLKMGWYDGSPLLGVLSTLRPREETYDFRFPVQDIYQVKGENVALGNIISGKIRRGDSVKISPGTERNLKVKKILVFNKTRLTAHMPESVGLVFNPDRALRRGQIVYKGVCPHTSRRIEAKIFCLDSIKMQTELLFRCATQVVNCEVSGIKESIDTATLDNKSPGEELDKLDAAGVVIDIKDDIAVERFCDLSWLGRFVIERDNQVVAVGIIV